MQVYLVENSELFGFEEGAFTGASRRQKGKFEMISGGTLLLDEIGDMSLDVQSRLLRVLEYQNFQRLGGTRTIEVNVRIITATNKDLKKLVDKEQFRDDLYYRINVFPINLPPLRELKNVIERAMILCKGEKITARHLILHDITKNQFDKMDLDKIVAFLMEDGGIDLIELEARLLRYAMGISENNVSKAARLLGLSRPTLQYRLEKYKL